MFLTSCTINITIDWWDNPFKYKDGQIDVISARQKDPAKPHIILLGKHKAAHNFPQGYLLLAGGYSSRNSVISSGSAFR